MVVKCRHPHLCVSLKVVVVEGVSSVVATVVMLSPVMKVEKLTLLLLVVDSSNWFVSFRARCVDKDDSPKVEIVVVSKVVVVVVGKVKATSSVVFVIRVVEVKVVVKKVPESSDDFVVGGENRVVSGSVEEKEKVTVVNVVVAVVVVADAVEVFIENSSSRSAKSMSSKASRTAA